MDVSTSKTGKHGHAKCVFVGTDIFTGKKMEDMHPSSHNCDVPVVNKNYWALLDIQDDGFVSLMDDAGNTKDDITLPKGTDEAEKLAASIRADFDAGKELVVSVQAVSERAQRVQRNMHSAAQHAHLKAQHREQHGGCKELGIG